MEIIIIEDEQLTSNDLIQTIIRVDPQISIQTVLRSVREAKEYFNSGSHKLPDLIFSDIKLGDGLSFEIFRDLTKRVPVIFCTAFDEFALNAFKANGIDYLLKPFSTATIKNSLEKYREMNTSKTVIQNDSYEKIFMAMSELKKPVAILVYHKDKVIPIRIDAIAALYLDRDQSKLLTLNGQVYSVDKSLDDMEVMVGKQFFRVNRQVILNHSIIIDVSYYFSRKLKINISLPFEFPITVSKERKPSFLQWLSGQE